MPPWQGGGGMIRSVTFEATTYDDPPRRFEAGTPAAAEAIGLAAAIDYVEGLGWPAIERHEAGLVEAAVAGLEPIPGLRLIGRPRGARRRGLVRRSRAFMPHDSGRCSTTTGSPCAPATTARSR